MSLGGFPLLQHVYLTRPIELTGHENPRERQFAQTPNKGLIKLGLSHILGGFRITLMGIVKTI
jgi:hypothetical protein